MEYISGSNPPHKRAFGVELSQNPHSKMVSKSILDPLTGHLPYYPRSKTKIAMHEGVYWKKTQVSRQLEIMPRKNI